MPDRSPTTALQSGGTIPINPPTITGAHYQAVALYNSSPDQVLVTYGSNTDILQPFTANSYPIGQQSYSVSVAAIDTNPQGTFVGTVAASWYRPDEAVPIFPFTLAVFPGGAFLIAQLAQLPATTTFEITVPPGSAQLLFNYNGTVGGYAVHVIGVQSGTNYTPVPQVAAPGAPVDVPIVGTIDTLFTVTLNPQAGTNGGISMYAQPGIIPTQATLTTGIITCAGGTTTIINSPASGAWYLFGFDLESTDPGTGSVIYIENSASGAVLGQLMAPDNAGNAAPLGDHTDLNGIRCNAQVNAVLHAGVTGLLVGRYAPGT